MGGGEGQEGGREGEREREREEGPHLLFPVENIDSCTLPHIGVAHQPHCGHLASCTGQEEDKHL